MLTPFQGFFYVLIFEKINNEKSIDEENDEDEEDVLTFVLMKSQKYDPWVRDAKLFHKFFKMLIYLCGFLFLYIPQSVPVYPFHHVGGLPASVIKDILLRHTQGVGY